MAVSNVTNAGSSAEEITISLTDVNAIRGTNAFGTQKIDWTGQEGTEGIVSGMLSSTEVIENMETSILDKLSLAELIEIRNIYKENKFYDPTAKNVAYDLNNSN